MFGFTNKVLDIFNCAEYIFSRTTKIVVVESMIFQYQVKKFLSVVCDVIRWILHEKNGDENFFFLNVILAL